jgi:hypothetical protein
MLSLALVHSWGLAMAATSISNNNAWRQLASERERSARVMTIVSVALAFALLGTYSYGHASSTRMSGLCAQIQDVRVNGGNNSAREIASSLAANYCS